MKGILSAIRHWIYLPLSGLLAGLAIAPCAGQTLAFEHLNSEQGLSQNSVMAITQDSRGFMWFGTRSGLNRYDGHQFRTYRNAATDSTSLSSSDVASLLNDSRQTLWIGTQNGLNRYNPTMDTFDQIPVESGKLSHKIVACLYEDRKGTLWVGTPNGLNQLLDHRKLRFKTHFAGKNIRVVYADAADNLWIGTADGLIYMTQKQGRYQVQQTFRHELGNPASLSDNYVTSLVEDAQHRLWIGTLNGGLNRYDPATRTFRRFIHNPANAASLAHNNIRKIRMDRQERLWIGTQEGLSLFDPTTQTFANYRHDAANPRSLSRNSIFSVFADKQGSVWLGTYYGGINVSHPHQTDFTVYRNRPDQPSLTDNVVSSIVEVPRNASEPGTFWIGTEGGGLNVLDQETGRFTAYKHNPANPASLGSNLVKVVYRDRQGQIWVGTHGGGLNQFNPDTKTFSRYLFREADAQSLNSEVQSMLESRTGTFWVGTNYGLSVFVSTRTPLVTRPSSQSVATVQQRIGQSAVKALWEDAAGSIWIGTATGLFMDGSAVPGSVLKNSHLPTTAINCIREDKAGRVWIGTASNGLSVYDRHTNALTTFTMDDGLPSNDVVGILDDDNGAVWISTANGLSRLDLRTRRFINYTTSDGLAGNDFNYNAACKTQTGQLLFGGYQGITAFYPQKIVISYQQTPIVFADFRLFNRPVRVGGGDELLTSDISLTKAITLEHDQNVFSLDFALLNFIKSDKNKYAYQLDGFDPDWLYAKTPSTTYTNLPAGHYTLRVKGANNDGVWSKPLLLSVTVRPPFWQTTWAYLLYAALLAGAIFFVIRFFVLRALLRRDHELNQLKLNFFTNISHEIRTHLTLIAGPIERLMLAHRDNSLIQKQLGYVQKDADRLLKLVTELMDFRKAETNHLNLNVGEYDLVSFLNEIHLFFREVSQSKQITTRFAPEPDSLMAWFDRAQLEKVLFNLLSNAVKFTPAGGQIELTLRQQGNQLQIQVIDNGRGIAPEYADKLFANYFQVADHGMQNTGYGIGLALSKAIVELHTGTLTVDSQQSETPGQNRTYFTVTLWAGRQHLEKFIDPSETRPESVRFTEPLLTEPLPGTKPEPEVRSPAKHKTSTILLVDDNPAVRAFVSESLAGAYQVIECTNGRTGWKTAIEQIPDLIISDITMPEMDGLTLCNQLKSDERTSHIPVILLTAQNTTASEVSGLALGADCYLTKPFSLQILELHIRNLLAARDTMRNRFSRQITLQPQNVVINPIEEKFLQRLTQIIDAQIDNPDLDVEQLAAEVGMSRSVLYKKLRALTDMSVNDFVKSYRLQKAEQLLRQKKLTVNEVAYSVGFNDRKYFSKEFKKQFGKSPSDYVTDMFTT